MRPVDRPQPSARTRAVLLLSNVKEDGCTSMHVYRDDIVAHMPKVESMYPSAPAAPRLYRNVAYPLSIPKGYGVYHILDQNYAHLALALRGQRVLQTCHDLIPIRLPNACPTFYRLLYRARVSCMAHAWRIAAISQSTKNDIMAILGIPEERIQVIPYGLNTHTFFPRSRHIAREMLHLEDRTVILSVGSDTYKNNERILRATATILPLFPKTALLKIGRFRPHERKIAGCLGIANHIIEVSGISHLRMADYYSAADVLLFPSLYEGFGRPILEAQACGVPVITSSVASMPEVAGDAALFVDPHSTASIAEALEQLLAAGLLRETLIQRGYANVARFSWEAHVAQLQALYRAAVQ